MREADPARENFGSSRACLRKAPALLSLWSLLCLSATPGPSGCHHRERFSQEGKWKKVFHRIIEQLNQPVLPTDFPVKWNNIGLAQKFIQIFLQYLSEKPERILGLTQCFVGRFQVTGFPKSLRNFLSTCQRSDTAKCPVKFIPTGAMII